MLADLLPAEDIPKYVDPLVIPPVMPKADTIMQQGGPPIDYYEIEVVQFQQQILPSTGFPKTPVWSYGAVGHPETRNYPAFTIEAQVNRPTRVKWVNNLVDENGDFLPHLLPVDQTLHWANPSQDCIDGTTRTDCRGQSQETYTGPVPIVTHVHGMRVAPESDGYPEAWWLPAANNLPPGSDPSGTLFGDITTTDADPNNDNPGNLGYALFQYPNDQPSATLWYHDHALGITRLNVYAGPAGFYLLRGEEEDNLNLPGSAPKPDGNRQGPQKFFEIPIAIQDRSFNEDGSLFYPDNRAFFEGLSPDQLKIDFLPDSDVPPIWNPEFFGNTMVVNGRTWPVLQVEPRRYRFRFLNGSNSRFLILKAVTAAQPDNSTTWSNLTDEFVQIGADGGFLPQPVALDELLMAPAERADVIVDFSGFAPGEAIYLVNVGPDEPFGGGRPGVDFEPANPETTGQVMKFQVVPLTEPDPSANPDTLVLPSFEELGPSTHTRQVSLNEEESQEVCVKVQKGKVQQIGCSPEAEEFGPIAALLGTLHNGMANPLFWENTITENPALGSTEIWEIYNFTEDAHPIHLHLVQFQVLNRQPFGDDGSSDPQPWETGFKDTVIALPGEITRIKAKFDIPGLYVWHCHILEHEDNEMMRPYCVGDPANCPANGAP
ncbi:multicopper oxidase family protein [Nitrosococcus halophilus]|uniref:multicopper oxidase family protein n=1 Tax=Nitrosococcus halophilus TaxID=133539 RepID=UPI0002D66CF8|nr:multicopper oxidase [Nitrosococcus halophilus]